MKQKSTNCEIYFCVLSSCVLKKKSYHSNHREEIIPPYVCTQCDLSYGKKCPPSHTLCKYMMMPALDSRLDVSLLGSGLDLFPSSNLPSRPVLAGFYQIDLGSLTISRSSCFQHFLLDLFFDWSIL